MSKEDLTFKIKLVPAEEVLNRILRNSLIIKTVDLYRRIHGKEALLKLEGGWTEVGAKLTIEEITKEFEAIPIRKDQLTLMLGESTNE